MIQQLADSAQIEQIFWARPLATPVMFLIFAAVVAWSIYLYRRSWGLRPWLRYTLGIARLIVLLLIVAALFEPMAVVRETQTYQRGLPVLVDVSESMSVIDPRKRSEDLAEAAAALDLIDQTVEDVSLNLDSKQRQAIASSSRLDLATTLLAKTAQPVLTSVGQSLDVSYHAFGDKATLVSDASALTSEDVKVLSAQESQSSIAVALEAVAKSGGAPPAGIVLLSDGIETGSSQRVEAVLRDLGARGINQIGRAHV